MRNHRTLGTKSMTRSTGGREREGERGQIMIMFTLVIVLLMALAAVVIDVSLLRTDGGKLQNALDGGALAAGQKLPANNTNVAAITATAVSFSQKNYPGMALGGEPVASRTSSTPASSAIDSNGLPRLTDMPSVCNVNFAANDPQWRCTTAVCWAPCQPDSTKVGYVATDVCNTIILYDNVTRQYSFGRAVGVNSGNTGVLSSAACTGCAATCHWRRSTSSLLLDRTGSAWTTRRPSQPPRRRAVASWRRSTRPSSAIALGFTGPTSAHADDGRLLRRRTTRPARSTRRQRLHHQQRAGSPSPARPRAATRTPSTRSPSTPTSTRRAPRRTSSPPTRTPMRRPVTTRSRSRGRPASVNVGDFLLASITVDDGNAVQRHARRAAPDGTPIRHDRQRRQRRRQRPTTSSRRAATRPPATGNWNLSSGTRAVGVVVRYTGVDPADPINAGRRGHRHHVVLQPERGRPVDQRRATATRR